MDVALAKVALWLFASLVTLGVIGGFELLPLTWVVVVVTLVVWALIVWAGEFILDELDF